MKENKMDIQLKHAEIESAVRAFVSEKIGINLTGKNLNIQFSMGRGPNALVANLAITDSTDVEVPGYTDRDADTVKTETNTAPATEAEQVSAAGQAELADMKAVQPKPVTTEPLIPAEDPALTPTDAAEIDEVKADAKPATTGGIFN
jgi:hypothetical protein